MVTSRLSTKISSGKYPQANLKHDLSKAKSGKNTEYQQLEVKNASSLFNKQLCAITQTKISVSV